jgi:hypothetical protein
LETDQTQSILFSPQHQPQPQPQRKLGTTAIVGCDNIRHDTIGHTSRCSCSTNETEMVELPGETGRNEEKMHSTLPCTQPQQQQHHQSCDSQPLPPTTTTTATRCLNKDDDHFNVDDDDTCNNEMDQPPPSPWSKGKEEYVSQQWGALDACMGTWPRCTTIGLRIVVPLWVLTVLCVVFGTMVARYEAPIEYDQNDGLCMERFLFHHLHEGEGTDTNITTTTATTTTTTTTATTLLDLLTAMPILCLERYLQSKNNGSSSSIEKEEEEDDDDEDDDESQQHQELLALWTSFASTNTTSSDDDDDDGDSLVSIFPVVELGFDNSSINSTLVELMDYMEACTEVSTRMLNDRGADRTIQQQQQQGNATQTSSLSTVCSDLTFQWIRCWNTTLYGGMNPLRPSSEQIGAADIQSDYYYQVWKHDQERLYDQYVVDYNCSSDRIDHDNNRYNGECNTMALNQSIMDATGSWSCSENIGGSSWF